MSPDRGSPARARLAVLGAAVLWSTSGACIKNLGLNTWQIASGRGLFAALVLAALVPEARRGWASRGVLAVAVAYAATTILYVWANTLTTSANAIFLQDVAPLWVLLLGPWLLRERPTRAEVRIAPVYLAGSALFFLDQLKPEHAAGNAVAIGSGIAFALLIVGLRHLRDGGAEAAVLAGNVLAFLIPLPLALGGPLPTGKDVALLAYLGVFQLGLAYVLFIRGLRGVSALEGSLLALLEPILNPIWALVFAGERPGPWAIAGGAVILGATALRIVTAPAQPPAEPSAGPPAAEVRGP